jgi:hypothetical protein
MLFHPATTGGPGVMPDCFFFLEWLAPVHWILKATTGDILLTDPYQNPGAGIF